jgi:uncharacterized membrane protein
VSLDREGSDYPPGRPVPAQAVLALLVLSVLAVSVFLVNVVSYAYRRVGLEEGWAFATVFASILGSRVNIPVGRLRGNTSIQRELVRRYGVLYVIRRPVRVGTKPVAVNLGGAVIPTALSVYLIARNALGWQAIAAVAVVATVAHLVARVIPSVGIVVPTFIPPLAAALTTLLFPVDAVAALAYVSGTLGTLIGADLMNLPRVRGLEAPVLSIGGAGTFDGIFVTGIVAVLLAAI